MAMDLLDQIGADQKRLQGTVLQSLREGVYFVDRNRRILLWNKAAEQLTGYPASAVVGSCCADGILQHVNEAGCQLCQHGCPLQAAMEDGQPREECLYMHHAEGHRVPVHVRADPMFDAQGQVVGCVEVFSDNTDRVAMLDRLRDIRAIAMKDELTGLANRRYFQSTLQANFARADRHQNPFGLIMADVDHFKQFNDRYGHDVGDKVLQLVARTLAHNCRPYDMAIRWGGEEFIILAEQVDATSLEALAQRIRMLVARSQVLAGKRKLRVTISAGATLVRRKDTAQTLLKRVDRLLYQSKKAGRNRVSFGL